MLLLMELFVELFLVMEVLQYDEICISHHDISCNQRQNDILVLEASLDDREDNLSPYNTYHIYRQVNILHKLVTWESPSSYDEIYNHSYENWCN